MCNFTGILIATDLDGTFLGAHGALVERNLEAVSRFKEGGGRFTAATGRVQHDMLRIIPQAAELFNAPAVMANGAYLYDFSEETAFSEQVMTPEDVTDFIRYVHALEPSVGVRVSSSAGFLADSERDNPYILKDLTGGRRRETAILKPMSEWELDTMRLYKMVVRGEPEVLSRIRPTVEAHFGGRYAYTSSAPSFFEIQRGGCDKGTGLRALAELLEGIDGRRPFTVAAGNHENDLPLLLAADAAVCPDDALEDIKPFCHRVLCGHTEGCIADLVDALEAWDAEGRPKLAWKMQHGKAQM